MKKILRHPLSWLGLILLIGAFVFLLFPETTDTGEEPEVETEANVERVEKEQDVLEDTALGKVLPVAPEPRDLTEEIIDTFPKGQ